MAHEVARLLLEQADSFVQREEAIRTAMQLGMSLREIQEYLDWLEMVRATDKTRNSGGMREI